MEKTEMQEKADRRTLEKLLETHFCDTQNPEIHGLSLKASADNYLRHFDFRKKAQVYNALSDETRLKILNLLTFREMCVCELTAALGVTQPNLSYHIGKLESSGLVKYSKRGRWIYYSISNSQHLDDLNQIRENLET
jgi:ArsR family transcriptional regulator